MLGTKVEYLSIPYPNIIKISKERAGLLDLNAKLKIWIKDLELQIKKQFGKGGNNINEVYKILIQHILK